MAQAGTAALGSRLAKFDDMAHSRPRFRVHRATSYLNGARRSPELVLRSATCSALGALLMSVACSSGGANETAVEGPKPPKERTTDFVTALSPEDIVTNLSAPGASPAATADGATGQAGGLAEDEGGDPERAISEADIIHIEGDTLYALSSYSGLTLVDMADPEDLKVLGHAPSSGEPFEMYVRDDVAISMVNAYGHYERDEETQQTTWVQTSRVLALDTSDPAEIRELGDLSVPGAISDSRLVGDVLYLVTTEYGCWGCSEGPSTVVTSFNIHDLANIEQIDQLRFEEPAETYIGQRSISVTAERIYIGGRDWNWPQTSEGSTIQVIDITDPGGDLAAGAALPIAGQIDSRWQMDEHNGVLRVLSQWEEWRSDSPPTLETYRVNSATDITKLASLVVQLPRPEVLQSVRFDAERAYAITFEQTDPLFTFDLSNPEAPVQMGELEIPGWVYHMEPRGDRLYAIGFEQGNETGALHVSLFDVADLANPQMLQRVNFGGDWASFAEDQDRIHKSFKLFNEEGLIVVPFSGWDWDTDGCRSSYSSGIQLVDFTTNTLTLRDIAPQVGQARRAFVHRDHLFGISDDAVQSFDIDDRDDIEKVDTLTTARNVNTVRVVGDKVLRFGTDWWTEQTILDVTGIDQVTDPTQHNALDLTDVLANTDECNGYAYWGNVYVVGEYAYVERNSYAYGESQSTEKLTLLVVNLATEKPEIVGELDVDLVTSGDNVYRYFSGVVQADSALLVGITEYDYSTDTRTTKTSYQVIDVRDPAHPVKTTTFEVPAELVSRGWGRFTGGCGLDFGWGWGGYYGGYYNYYDQNTALVSGDIIASSHVEQLEDNQTRGRYYLDRFDVSDPEHPVVLDKVNVPGRVTHFEADAGRILTIEDRYEAVALNREDCWARSGAEPNVQWTYTDPQNSDQGLCNKTNKFVHLLALEDGAAELLETASLDGDDWYFSSTSITKDRIFIRQYQTKEITETYNDQTYTYWGWDKTRIRVLDASLALVTNFDGDGNQNWNELRARGKRAFMSENGTLRVFDTSDVDAPKVVDKELLGYGCESLEVRDNVAVCSQGKKGVESFSLD